MIYTRFGSPVTIEAVDFGQDEAWVTIKYEDGKTREVAFSDLRADEGFQEILAEIYRRFPEHDPHSEHYQPECDTAPPPDVT